VPSRVLRKKSGEASTLAVRPRGSAPPNEISMESRKSHEPQTQSNLPPLGRLLDSLVVATAGVRIAAVASANTVEKSAVPTDTHCGKS